MALPVHSKDSAIHDGWKDEFSDFGGVQGSRGAKQNGAGKMSGITVACVGEGGGGHRCVGEGEQNSEKESGDGQASHVALVVQPAWVAHVE